MNYQFRMHKSKNVFTTIANILFLLTILSFIWKKRKRIMNFYNEAMEMAARFQEEGAVVSDIVSETLKSQVPTITRHQVQRAAKSTKRKAVRAVKRAKVQAAQILNTRQQKILDIIAAEQQLDMSKLMKRVRGVSDRTLRRDMTYLEEHGLISRTGKTKDTTYSLNN